MADHLFCDQHFVFIYLDDILIALPDEHAHIKPLETVFQILDHNNIEISADKCEFQKPFNFLGFLISVEGIKPPDNKITAIWDFTKAPTYPELCRFVGMIGFYCRMIPKFADLVAEYSGKFWLFTAGQAFTNASTLSHPVVDVADHQIVCDASQVAVGDATSLNPFLF